jgi:hypothetical protein
MCVVVVKGGLWIEVGELVIVVGRWAILVHIHIGRFDRFFGVDFRQHKFVVDPMIVCENTREIVLGG